MEPCSICDPPQWVYMCNVFMCVHVHTCSCTCTHMWSLCDSDEEQRAKNGPRQSCAHHTQPRYISLFELGLHVLLHMYIASFHFTHWFRTPPLCLYIRAMGYGYRRMCTELWFLRECSITGCSGHRILQATDH